MSGYEIKVSVTALCVCCGKELPPSAYLTKARPSEGVLDRDNPWERTDRQVFITPCADCFAPRAAVAELMEATTAYLDGRKWYNPLYANKRQFDTFAAVESRLTAALIRVRSAA